jgi:hypothetical protein
MKGNELVWRALADAALRGERRWQNAGDLAHAAGVPSSSAYFALTRLEEIGAIARYPRGGFSVVSIEKVVTVLCAWRNLNRDTLAMTTIQAISPLLDTSRGPYALGGPDAANSLLGGVHVADFHEHLVYLSPKADLNDLPDGDEVRVLAMDKRAIREWAGYSSLAQTYADLFATAGWAASEYRYALRDRYMKDREWDQESIDD